MIENVIALLLSYRSTWGLTERDLMGLFGHTETLEVHCRQRLLVYRIPAHMFRRDRNSTLSIIGLIQTPYMLPWSFVSFTAGVFHLFMATTLYIAIIGPPPPLITLIFQNGPVNTDFNNRRVSLSARGRAATTRYIQLPCFQRWFLYLIIVFGIDTSAFAGRALTWISYI